MRNTGDVIAMQHEKDTQYLSGGVCEWNGMGLPRLLGFEPVGRWYEAHSLRRQHKHTLSNQSLESTSSNEDVNTNKEDEDDAFLYGLDPTEWKKQDHYAVLGMRKLRWYATPEQIKRAYRKKVLRHHPDKRRARGICVKGEDDDYFTCITRAYEILGNETKRRSFDSVDPEFDDSVPSKEQVVIGQFYSVFTQVFKRNSKWSGKKKVPKLGNDNSSHDDVCNFYSFWYEFESWREFSYLDEEEKEKGENREERRWIEKQNKSARQKLKKEETARIRLLVDNAYATDPRIQRFKDEEKAKKLAQKQAKQEAIRARQEEEERQKREVEETERLKKEEEEERLRAQVILLKKKKEEHKKMLKKERKMFRSYSSTFNCFIKEGSVPKQNHLGDVEKLADGLSLENLQTLNEDLSTADHTTACEIYTKQLSAYNSEREREKQAMLDSLHKRTTSTDSSPASNKKEWTDEEVQCLIKGVNVMPAGTQDRWEVISHFITQHVPNSSRSAKDVLAKAKDLQKNDMPLKMNASKKAFENFEKDRKSAQVSSAPSERLDSVADQQIRETGSNPGTWSADEQKLLEQALKTYPTSCLDRWDKIAGVVATRSKKDCMKRYKELVELIKAKKAAQDATRAKKS